MSATPILAIDFGSSRTKAAYRHPRKGDIRLARIGNGSLEFIPSLVHFSADPGQAPRVGGDAEQAAEDDPVGLVFDVKRDIHKKTLIEFDGSRPPVSRVHAATQIFRHVRSVCGSDVFGQPVDRCVLTIPAACPEPQRLGIQAAAREAGFVSTEFLPEPVAAALAYLDESPSETTDGFVVVCDIGGGTTDFAVVTVRGGTPEVHADALPESIRLGGNDLDERILRKLIDAAQPDGRTLLAHLRNFCTNKVREVREGIRNRRVESVALRGDLPAVTRADIEGAQARFVEEVAENLRRYMERNRDALGEGPVRTLLVGGGARIAGMRQAVERLELGPVLQWDNGDLAVVRGALWSGAEQAGGVGAGVAAPTEFHPYTEQLLALANGVIEDVGWQRLLQARETLQLTAGEANTLERAAWGATLEEICRPTRGVDREIDALVSEEEVTAGSKKIDYTDPHLGVKQVLALKLKKGWESTRHRLPGKGLPGLFGGEPGDLYVRLAYAGTKPAGLMPGQPKTSADRTSGVDAVPLAIAFATPEYGMFIRVPRQDRIRGGDDMMNTHLPMGADLLLTNISRGPLNNVTLRLARAGGKPALEPAVVAKALDEDERVRLTMLDTEWRLQPDDEIEVTWHGATAPLQHRVGAPEIAYDENRIVPVAAVWVPGSFSGKILQITNLGEKVLRGFKVNSSAGEATIDRLERDIPTKFGWLEFSGSRNLQTGDLVEISCLGKHDATLGNHHRMKLASQYVGNCHNETHGASARLRITFSNVDPQALCGKLTIDAPLSGSAAFVGMQEGNAIKLISGREGREYIIWRGVISDKTLVGKYTVYLEGLVQRMTGGSTAQAGRFDCAAA